MKRYRNSPLTEKRYHYIKQYLAFKGNRYASDMTGYSMSTVNLVNRTKDFEEFQSYNKSRKAPKTHSTATLHHDGYNYTWTNPKEEDSELNRLDWFIFHQNKVNESSFQLFKLNAELISNLKVSMFMLFISVVALTVMFILK